MRCVTWAHVTMATHVAAPLSGSRFTMVTCMLKTYMFSSACSFGCAKTQSAILKPKRVLNVFLASTVMLPVSVTGLFCAYKRCPDPVHQLIRV